MIFASHQLGKMSDSRSKCPAKRWRPAGHFVRHARNNFRNHWLVALINCTHFNWKVLYEPICKCQWRRGYLFWSNFVGATKIWSQILGGYTNSITNFRGLSFFTCRGGLSVCDRQLSIFLVPLCMWKKNSGPPLGRRKKILVPPLACAVPGLVLSDLP